MQTASQMDLPTRPDDALAQPTRARLFAVLGELRRPTSTDELAERWGLHPNGVRVHLERPDLVGFKPSLVDKRVKFLRLGVCWRGPLHWTHLSPSLLW